MLDIHALHDQLHAMSEALGQEAALSAGRLGAAMRLYDAAVADAGPLDDRLDAYAALAQPPWLVARPVEPLGAVHPLPPHGGPCTVVATDGSQIAPSHHEIAWCYLLNVGRILYTYGTGEAPLQDSRPSLYHRQSDMRPLFGNQPVALSETLLGALRDVQEREALVELARMAAERAHPAIALSDGTLIQWTLEHQPPHVREALLADHLAALDALRSLGVPVAGYISGSRANEVTALLKLAACPKPQLVCERCAQADPPCEKAHWPIGDRRLWEGRLRPGERSALFASQSAILERYGPHRVMFFYLHVGAEVARVEVPAWVAEDAGLIARVHALCFDQAQKGLGYPIALQEAHNQAVLTGEDRTRFFSSLQSRLHERGLRVSQTPKQLKKRSGLV